MDLRRMVKEPHPTKEVFRRHGIQLWQLAVRLDLSTTYIARILNGDFNHRLRPEIDEALKKMARQLERNAEKEKAKAH